MLSNESWRVVPGNDVPCIQAAQRYGWRRFLGRCLAAVELVVFLIVSGCFHAAQVTAEQEPVARSLIRPIDIDTSTARKIGREALAKIGYEEVIKLAERAGFVAYKTEATIQLASYESAVVAGFVPVFSRYAAAAAVTAQADSPLPGPADVAAVGVLVVGLIDGGLLDGQLLRSFGDWLSVVNGTILMAQTKGEPKPSPSFSPPTNPPQLPPAEIPSGWRVR